MNTKLKIHSLFLALALTLSAVQHSQAAWEPDDLVDSSWDIFSTARASVQRLGRVSTGKVVTLDFTGDSDFELTMLDEFDIEIGFTGTYLPGARGITITQDNIDPQELQDFIESHVDMIAYFEDFDVDNYDITGFSNVTAKLSIKPRDRIDKNTLEKSIDFKFSARITARVQGQARDDGDSPWEDFDLAVVLTLKGKTTKDLGDYDGSDWDITERNREFIKASSLRTVSDQHVMTLDLEDKVAGDQPATFRYEDDLGQGFGGTYSRKGNKVTLYPDIFELQIFIIEKIIEADDQIPDIDIFPDNIWFLKYRNTVIIKENTDPDSIVVNIKIFFVVDGWTFDGFDFLQFEYKGLYSFTGTGILAP